MKQYTTLSPERVVMRTHAFGVLPREGFALVELAGIELWIMIEPEGNLWTWDGWVWN